MNTKRVFFAILPPKSLYKQLTGIKKSLSDVFPEEDIRWIEVENFHVTLQFINNVSETQLIPLIRDVGTLLKNTSSFQLEIGGLEWFPGLEYPKVIALSVEPQEILCKLSDAMKPIIDNLNIISGTHPFRGHISIGRLKHNDISRELLTHVKIPLMEPITIDRVYLIESKPDVGGRVYQVMDEFKLTPYCN